MLCFQANIYCIILCKILKIKIIVRSNSSPSGWANNTLKNLIFKIFLNKADQVIVNSLEFKNELRKSFNLRAECIYNPLNTREIKIKSKENSKKIFSKKKILKIISVGRFVHQKDKVEIFFGLLKTV